MELMSSEEILDLLYKKLLVILSNLDIYALKGGYIMSHYIAKGMRYSSDIDLSISKAKDFESIKSSIVPLLDSLKNEGQICKYKIKEPQVTESGNRSGCFKLYRNTGENTPARLLCGIDVSIHDLSFGVIVINDEVSSFSIERMLADKISILYSDLNTLVRRCRDMYDIFLFDFICAKVDKDSLNKCFSYRNININSKSTLEGLNKEDLKQLYIALDNLLKDESRVELSYIQEYNVSVSNVIRTNLWVLDFLRRSL